MQLKQFLFTLKPFAILISILIFGFYFVVERQCFFCVALGLQCSILDHAVLNSEIQMILASAQEGLMAEQHACYLSVFFYCLMNLQYRFLYISRISSDAELLEI